MVKSDFRLLDHVCQPRLKAGFHTWFVSANCVQQAGAGIKVERTRQYVSILRRAWGKAPGPASNAADEH